MFPRALALLSAAGCLTLLPAPWAGEEPAAAPAGAASGAQESPAKPAKQVKAPKPAKASKQARAAKPAKAGKKQPADASPQVLTGSHLKQRIPLRRFPETTSPVEIWDRQVIERRGEATLGGFLGRQATFR